MPSTLDRLAQHLDASPGEVRQALRALREALHDEAARSGEAPLAALGTFRRAGDALRSERSEALAEAVNERFAGLETLRLPAPETVSPAFSKSEVVAASGAEAEAASEMRPEEPVERESADGAARSWLSERLAAYPAPLAPVFVRESAFVGATLAPRGEAAPPIAAPASATAAGAEGVEDERSALLPWLIAAALVLAVGIGLWSYLSRPGAPPPEDPPATQEDIAAATPEEPAPRSEQPAPADTMDAAPAPADTAAAPAPAGDAEGNAEDDAEGGAEDEPDETATPWPPGTWTIVVASEPSRTRAEIRLNTYRDRFAGVDHPVGILDAGLDAGTRYRVVVGRFATPDASRAALDRYQDRLPEGAWLLQVEPNE